MEITTKKVPLTFNKLFLLSIKRPSEEIISDQRLSYSIDDEEDISNSIQRGTPPLLLKEIHNVFWLGVEFCTKLELFENLYPYSKFILIHNKECSLDHKFCKQILNYFQPSIKYNDIILPLNNNQFKSNSFTTLDESEGDRSKIIDFLFKPMIV